jgi:hypothetical protein
MKRNRPDIYLCRNSESRIRENCALDLQSQVQTREVSIGLQTVLGFVCAQSGLEMGQTHVDSVYLAPERLYNEAICSA